MGLCKILTDTGSVVAVSAQIVYEREVESLIITPGAGGEAKYKPYYGSEPLGKPAIVYSTAVLPSGIKHVEFMRRSEWESIMERSEAVKSYRAKQAKNEYAPVPTWITDEAEMIRKTCIKRHYKYLPKTEQAERIAQAIEIDNVANGIDFDNKNQDQPQTTNAPAGATPGTTQPTDNGNPPADYALATEEDYIALLALLDNEKMPDLVFENIKKVAMRSAIVTKYLKGTLLKDKAEEYIKKLKEQLEAVGVDQPPVDDVSQETTETTASTEATDAPKDETEY
jgi:hypothetical protein